MEGEVGWGVGGRGVGGVIEEAVIIAQYQLYIYNSIYLTFLLGI